MLSGLLDGKVKVLKAMESFRGELDLDGFSGSWTRLVWHDYPFSFPIVRSIITVAICQGKKKRKAPRSLAAPLSDDQALQLVTNL
jgi:hypothetical protein